jgi:hypothetical protein
VTAGAPLTLTALKAGIDRRKRKGGTNPGELYDLLNGYVNGRGRIVARGGTEEETTALAGTIGLMTFDDEFVVFAIEAVAVPSGYVCEIIQHPITPTLELAKIHFAEAYMGFPYVCAEFANGDVYDFWLRRADAWEAETVYLEGQLVEPTTPNGYVYRAKRTGAAAPTWAPNVLRAENDIIEPTVANGYRYTCTDVLGANPRSGATEPTWPTETGALVYEDTDLAQPGAPLAGGLTDDELAVQVPEDTDDRYDNIGGGDSLSDTLRDLQNR